MEDVWVAEVERADPGSEAAFLTLNSRSGQVVAFCFLCAYGAGDRIANRLHLFLLHLGLTMLCVGCSTAPGKSPVVAPLQAPVAAEPADRVLDTAECSELGNIDLDSFGRGQIAGNPYGWVHARIDVERGAVVKVEIVNSSPKKFFDEQATALMKSWRFPSGTSASGCFVTHRWD